MRKIYKIIIICLSFATLFSCMSTKYIRTGEELSPVSWDEEIIIFDTSKPEKKYQKIGLLRISGGDQNKRIERARLYARKKGGNGIIVGKIGVITDPETGDIIEEGEPSAYETQEFVIIRLLDEKIATSQPEAEKQKTAEEEGREEKASETPKAAAVPEKEIELPPVPGKTAEPALIDYSTLPRASFRLLVNDYKSLEGKMFRGALMPKKIYKIPSSLKSVAGIDDRLVMLTTKSGKLKIYLIINKALVPDFINKIKAGETLDFVYSPAGVYSSGKVDYPVLDFIEEIIE